MSIGPDPATSTGDDTRSGLDRRRATRFAVAGLAIVVAVVFMAQNNEEVELDFLMFDITARLWVGLLFALVLGALLGQAAEVLWARRRRRRSADD